MLLYKFVLKTLKYCSINFLIFTLLLSFKRHLLPGILFYEGIFTLVFSTTFFLLYLWKFNNSPDDKVHDAYTIIISFFIILTFHTTVITIVDRSISVFIISNVKNGVDNPELVGENFINNFTIKGIDKRIQEQSKINNIIIEQNKLTLSWKGEFYYKMFSLIQKVYSTDEGILNKISEKPR